MNYKYNDFVKNFENNSANLKAIKHWYETTDKAAPVEILVDGKSIKMTVPTSAGTFNLYSTFQNKNIALNVEDSNIYDTSTTSKAKFILACASSLIIFPHLC